jgi:outer membrane receptor for ferrienterochelin and colicins
MLPQYRVDAVSPSYFIMNAQITKKFRKWEFYVGAENMLNYKQKDPILGAHNPFGSHFDASMIYAPITGIMGYAGLRLTLK